MTVLQSELQEGSTSRNLMGDGNMDHMLDASRCGHVRCHVLLDLVETGKNTGDGQNMTQEPGAQENCDKGRQILLNRNLFHALMGTLNLEMHVKHHFQVNVYRASTGLLAGELFYNAMCVFFSLMHAKSADPPFSDNVKNTMNSICLFKWFTEITLCPKEC
jgi:hypothetical protein